MSCHSTPGNSAATSLACALTHTPSDEVSRRFHQLKKEAPTDALPPTVTDVEKWLEHAAFAVRADEDLSAWREERLLRQIEAAQIALPADLPDAPTWYAWQNLRAACDDAHTLGWLASASGMDLPLKEMVPQAIDEALSAAWTNVYALTDRRSRLLQDVRYATQNLGRYGITPATLATRQAAVNANQELIDAAMDRTAPFETEYIRRGRWARYFRVETSGSGHVHQSMSCHSCFPATRYSWLPALSGKGEIEAVDDYGNELCSHCFPHVLSHPSYETAGRVALLRAEERAVITRERDAVKAAKGILSPTGQVLRIRLHERYPETIRTAVTAERTATAYIEKTLTYLSIEMIAEFAADSDDPAGKTRHLMGIRAETEADITLLVSALAHKRGETVEAVRTKLEEKAAKKIRRAARTR